MERRDEKKGLRVWNGFIEKGCKEEWRGVMKRKYVRERWNAGWS
jgi:hypothetical protein